MPMPAHLELEGANQGKIEGSCELQGREGTIMVWAFNHDVHIPRHPQTGLPTGKRIHGSMTITKEFDKSSPKLYQALCHGETFTNVTIKWYRIDPTGVEEHYFTTKLEDAIVVGIKAWMPSALDEKNDPYKHMEDVSFSYKKIIWTWEPDGIETEDDWTAPAS